VSPEERIGPVKALLAAFSARDGEAFAAQLTEDVVLRPSAFISGRGEYLGREDVITGFAEMLEGLESSGETVDLHPLRYLVDGADESLVLLLCRITITRPDGESYGTDIAYLCRLEGVRVARLDAWLDHDEGLLRLEQPVEVE
jgi:ketosteroid isomerase-like protein